MQPITVAQLRLIMPAAGLHADLYVGPLNAAMSRYMIRTVSRTAMFLAQVGHESASLICVEEHLQYSAGALVATWPKHFDTATAEAFQYQPEKIANRAYADRNGNGDEASGDGYKFRGRGPIQITGRTNYSSCGANIGQDLIGNPDLVATPEIGAMAAGWFWSVNGLNRLADLSDFRGVTQRINGGQTGYADRLAFMMRAESALGSAK